MTEDQREIRRKKSAGIGARKMKYLRDTYASHPLSAGIPLAYVSRQLGHQSMQLTERHYAQWIPDGDDYRPPLQLAPGEVPADLLARLGDAGIGSRQGGNADATRSLPESRTDRDSRLPGVDLPTGRRAGEARVRGHGLE